MLGCIPWALLTGAQGVPECKTGWGWEGMGGEGELGVAARSRYMGLDPLRRGEGGGGGGRERGSEGDMVLHGSLAGNPYRLLLLLLTVHQAFLALSLSLLALGASLPGQVHQGPAGAPKAGLGPRLALE
jgi:hypothetical protein